MKREDWVHFAKAHFANQSGLRTGRWLGLLCLLVGVGHAGFYAPTVTDMLLIITGLFGISRKTFMIWALLRRASQHPFFGKEVEAIINGGGLTLRCGNKSYTQPWHNFYAFSQLPPGLALYYERDTFLFIPEKALPPNDMEKMSALLQQANLVEIKPEAAVNPQ